MTQFILSHQLKGLPELKQSRESKIRPLVNNLKFNDVNDENNFMRIVSGIKKEILLTPVKIEVGKFVDHSYSEKKITNRDMVYGSNNKDIYTHIISYKFSGDSEIFKYRILNGFTISSTTVGFYQPVGNTITIDIDLHELNPTKAISEANNLMRDTFDLINDNNKEIETWNYHVEQEIDRLLSAKKEELIRIFGNL
jgi:hypothetical protein